MSSSDAVVAQSAFQALGKEPKENLPPSRSFGTIREMTIEPLLKYWLKMEEQPALIRDIVTKTGFKREIVKEISNVCEAEAKR
ncbi:hypothetical protein HA466_0219400 [Hirschfeldia incana]|nr:hypothetical protein HA466_0219400 [Hirschfeldia incana]